MPQKIELPEVILKKAKDIILSKGFEELNIRDIAKKTGCSIGTIYNHYKNLDQIMRKINKDTLDSLCFELEKVIKSKEGSIIDIDLFSEMAGCYIDFAINNYELWQLLSKHSIITNKNISEWLQNSNNTAISLINSLVYEFFRRNDIRLMNNTKSREVTTIIWSGLYGISTLNISKNTGHINNDSTKDLARSFVVNYLKGVISD